MRTALLLATLIVAAAQDTEVVRIMKKFLERRESARSRDEFRGAVRDALADLDAYARKAKPDDADLPRAMFHASEMYLHLEETESALDRFEAFVKKFPDNKDFSSTARFILGEVSLRLGREEKARENFAEFVKHADPADPRVFGAKFLSTLSYVNQKRYDDAVAGLQALRKEAGAAPEGWSIVVQLALTYHLMERPEEARTALVDVIKNCPDIPMVERSKQLLADWIAVGHPAVEFRAKDVAGADFARPAGRVTLLYFFTTTFEQAAAEFALMRTIHDWFPDKDFAVMGIAIDKKKDDVEKFVKEQKPAWQIVCDGDGFDGPLAKQLNVKNLPFVMLIDRKGVVRFFNPIYTPGGLEVKPVIQKLVDEK